MIRVNVTKNCLGIFSSNYGACCDNLFMLQSHPRSFKQVFRAGGKIKAWFPLDRNGIVKSCDSSRFWLIVERLITFENKYLTKIGSDLQLKRFLS